MRLAALLIAPLLAGCPFVPAGDIVIVTGSTEAAPHAEISLALYCDYLFAGRELAAGGSSCNGVWGVIEPACTAWECEHEGGNATLGFIDDCGVYVAPSARPPGPIVIIGTECDSLHCADACSASITLGLAGYDDPP